jgi:hypothetical protein
MPAILASLAAAALFASTPACEVRDTAATPHPPDSALSLVLNLPAFRVDVRDGSGTIHSYTVAVGSRRYRTPVGRYHVSSVELNPWWHPPDSEWARKEKVTPPGPNNPMGRAKLNFHELYFLHGTPLEESLGSAASHGCVRMASADALDLARRVLAFARPDVSAEEIDALEASRRTRHYALRVAVPLEIVYRTAEVRDGALELHPDVYRRESTTLRARALGALREEGVGEHLVDPVRLDSAVRAARREHVRVELDLLLRSRSPDTAVETDSIPGPARPAERSDDSHSHARRRRSPVARAGAAM